MNEFLNPDVQPLVDKIYEEGVQKANEQAKQIIAEAQKKASELIEGAKEHIRQLEAQSLKEQNDKRHSLNLEMRAVSKQVIGATKNELAQVVTDRISGTGIREALSEKEFLQKMIVTVLQKWEPNAPKFQIETFLNKEEEIQLKDFFEQRMKTEMTAEIEIVIDNKIKSGFKLGIKNENYYVSFCDEDFENFFKSFLRKKTNQWIYETNGNNE